jgi:hypothetical protein
MIVRAANHEQCCTYWIRDFVIVRAGRLIHSAVPMRLVALWLAELADLFTLQYWLDWWLCDCQSWQINSHWCTYWVRGLWLAEPYWHNAENKNLIVRGLAWTLAIECLASYFNCVTAKVLVNGMKENAVSAWRLQIWARTFFWGEGYFKVLSLIVLCWVVGWIISDDMERGWKCFVPFIVPFCHFYGGIEENRKNKIADDSDRFQSRYHQNVGLRCYH